MAEEEKVDVVNENNVVVGSVDAADAHRRKLMHRVVGVFVFADDGDLYVQTGNKYGKLDVSAGGHVHKGEAYEDAAKRELAEELGLTVPMQYVTTFLPQNARLNHYWAVYTATAPPDWQFESTEEVQSLEKMSMDRVRRMMDSQPHRFTHGFINTMRELIRIKEDYE